METVLLGKSGVSVPVMGVGTMLWTPNKSLSEDTVQDTYSACVDNNLNFFGTAEIYGNGKSERILGACMKRDGRPVLVASKFAPPSKMIPMTHKRFSTSKDSPRALSEALAGSLSRLGVEYLDLYHMHAPPSKNSISDYMEVMAEAVKSGKVRAVGVCNFSEAQIREAHAALAGHGIPLATAMAGYSLLRRYPETNGIFDACKELDVAFIPYAPLAEGILTGKYRPGGKRVPLSYAAVVYFGHLDITKEHGDSRLLISRIFSKPMELDRKKTEPLFRVMEEIAEAHGKTMAQVAINWLLTNDDITVIPIPGMKNAKQVRDNLGALEWRLTREERSRINSI